MLCLFGFVATAVGVSPEEAAFFGFEDLKAHYPYVDGTGYSYGIADTEFDLTHPAFGWQSSESYSFWYNSAATIPRLPLLSPRSLAVANLYFAQTNFVSQHGTMMRSVAEPITHCNTVRSRTGSPHGTYVLGVVASDAEGPGGTSLGVVPKAKWVLTSDSSDSRYTLGLIPDGNPHRTVAINRSVTSFGKLFSPERENAGVITLNSAGGLLNGSGWYRLGVSGRAPEDYQVRWLESIGYDISVGGLTDVTATSADIAFPGSGRSQETIMTDVNVHTVGPNGAWDIDAGGTSFSCPLLLGGVVLIQQAYALHYGGAWLGQEQMLRILMRSAKHFDDPYTGLRLFVADVYDAVETAIAYDGDPSREPNFTYAFQPQARVNVHPTDPYYPDPRYFRASMHYTHGVSNFTAPRITSEGLTFEGKRGPGAACMALRNGWGDLAVVDLGHDGKSVHVACDFQTDPGVTGGATTFHLATKEMVGSRQFMDAARWGDWRDVGRVGFRISSFAGSNDMWLVEALRCTELAITNVEPWDRNSATTPPEWNATPLASTWVTNLVATNWYRLEASFDRMNMRLMMNSNTVLQADHGANQVMLSRSTPYFHFAHASTDQVTRVQSFEVRTETTNAPVVSVWTKRARVLEGMEGVGAVADGLVKIQRAGSTDHALTVNYVVGGTATAGTDYETLPGVFTLPEGVATGELFVKPKADAVPEADETVTVTMQPAAGYQLSGSTVATVTIEDWTDPDHDGVMNWDENFDCNHTFADDDADYDMLPNYLDTDDDGDGVASTNEDLNANGNLLDDDADLDGLPNFVDDDDDGDALDIWDEDLNLDGDPFNDDTDGDGVPNAYDADDDGDGIWSIDEDYNLDGDVTNDDVDGDLVPDYLDVDTVQTSGYSTLHLAGDFNAWSVSNVPFQLVGSGVWSRVLFLDHATNVQFMVVPDQTLSNAWGNADGAYSSLPATGTGDVGASPVSVAAELFGTYRFMFNEADETFRMEEASGLDVDQDGMDDYWEIYYGLNPNDAADAQLDGDGDGLTHREECKAMTHPGAADSDGDGETDAEELVASTDPNDGSDYLDVEIVNGALVWPGAYGRRYTVESNEDPVTNNIWGGVSGATNLIGYGPEMTWDLPVPGGADVKFWRIRVDPGL